MKKLGFIMILCLAGMCRADVAPGPPVPKPRSQLAPIAPTSLQFAISGVLVSSIIIGGGLVLAKLRKTGGA